MPAVVETLLLGAALVLLGGAMTLLGSVFRW